MTHLADDQGLALARGYLLDPGGWGGPPLDVQVTQVSDLMDFDTVVGTAHLAGIRKQAFDDSAASAVPYLFRVVVEVPILILRASETLPHQRWFACPLEGDLWSRRGPWSVWSTAR